MNAVAHPIDRAFEVGDQVVIDAPGLPIHGKKAVVTDHRHVGYPLDQLMVGIRVGDWSQWCLPDQVRRAQ